MDLNLYITLVVNLVIIFTGITAYLHDRRSVSNILFFLVSAATLFWSAARYMSVIAGPDTALWWIRLDLFFAAPHTVLFLLFINNFPKRELAISKKLLVSAGAILFLTMLSTLSPFVFSGLANGEIGVIPVAGPLMPLFGAVTAGSVIAGAFLAFQKYFRSQSAERVQWRVLLFGISASYLSLIITNFLFVLLYGNTTFITFGPLFMLPLIIGAGYAIWKHELLNIKIVAAEILTFTILAISFFEILAFQNMTQLYFKASIFALFFIFGVMLIKSVLKEVEQRKKLELLTARLETANAELKKLDQTKSEFMSIASHQLRAPLTLIKGYISLILEGTIKSGEEAEKDALEKVAKSTEELIKLINGLLDLSRIESGKIKYVFEENDFVKVAEEVIAEFKESAAKKSLTLSLENKVGALAPFMFDADKIKEVIVNLVDNAIKYSASGEALQNFSLKNLDGQVLIRLEKIPSDKTKIRLSVKDSGMGIKQEDQKRLFAKFMRTEEANKNDPNGMGIGLYFVKRVVEDHGGKVWVESEGLGKGSTFFVELPLNK